MADSSAQKIDVEHAPTGPHGQVYLASGNALSMRLWEEEPGDADGKNEHTSPYETIGYVMEGRAELELDGKTITLEAGDSWVVPKGAEHTYTILESFKAVEATTPPARMHDE